MSYNKHFHILIEIEWIKSSEIFSINFSIQFHCLNYDYSSITFNKTKKVLWK